MKIAVIGAGAAGLMAAVKAAENAEVTLFERNEKPGKKIYITGKGRCNLTNLCSPEAVLSKVVSNAKFLYGSVYAFPPQKTIEFFADCGLETKTERGGRVFPVSDKASDVTKALLSRLKTADIITGRRVLSLVRSAKGFKINEGIEEFDRVIVATGGKTYPGTGSEGDGYHIAASFGHRIVEPRPSLTSLKLFKPLPELRGLTLKNVGVSVEGGGAPAQRGEMLFTDDGVSGPVILTLSAYLNRAAFPRFIIVDLKPSLSAEVLDARILSDFALYSNRQLKNALRDLLPAAIVPVFIGDAGLDGAKKVNFITRAERERLVRVVKEWRLETSGLGSMDGAVVTAGGVDVGEVDPKTLQSRLIEGLYFAGEVLDVDALTGGYNLQIAWSTGSRAGEAAAGGAL